MRTFLDQYINSLTYSERLTSNNFLYATRDPSISYSTPIINMRFTSGSSLPPFVLPMQIVTDTSYNVLFESTYSDTKQLFKQINQAAGIRVGMNEMVSSKLEQIESAIIELDREISEWEDLLVDTPEARGSISRSFGQTGMRPVVEYAGDLERTALTIQANVAVSIEGELCVAELLDSISEPWFSDEDGLQVRMNYTYIPGRVNTIKLEPVSGIGSITIVEGRLYNSQGNEIAKFAEGLELNKTIDFTINPVVISRIELDLLDTTFNLRNESTTTTVEKRIVIPAKTERIITGYRTVQGYTRPSDPIQAVVRVPTNYYAGMTNIFDSTGYRGQIKWIYGQPTEARKAAAAEAYERITGIHIDIGQSYLVYTENLTFHRLALRLFTRIPGAEKQLPIYEIIQIPEKILIEEEEVSTTYNVYKYEAGLSRLTASSNFYTERRCWEEWLEFEHGMPMNFNLMVDEYLPHGGYINFFIFGKDGTLIPLCPNNREWTTEPVSFDEYGEYRLMFKPVGEVYFYKGEQDATIPYSNGVAFGISGTSGHWVKYQPDKDKINIIPYASRIGTYYSEEGRLGEVHNRIPENKTITLKRHPWVDFSRIGDSDYHPVTVDIDGYTTSDLTNWRRRREEIFPINPVQADNMRTLHFKVRGNSIFFEDSVDTTVRILYEYVATQAKIVVCTGILHEHAETPVLYSFTLNYTEATEWM